MRTDSDGLYGQQRVANAIRPAWSVYSYLDGVALGSVPVLSGSITDDESSSTRAQLHITVPLLPELLAGGSGPLGDSGQTLQVHKSVNGSEIYLGAYLISYARPDNGVIDVVADGPLIKLSRARLTADVNYDGTFVGAVQLLATNVCTVRIDSGLTDRQMPQSVVWARGDDRLQRFYEVLSAWPAELTVQDDGTVLIRPPYDDDAPGDPVEIYVDGQGAAAASTPATLIDVSPAADTQDAYNAEIVSTAPGEGLSGVSSGAYITGGPTRWTGPFGRRPAFFSSPLLAEDDLPTVAVARLAKDQRRQGKLTVQVVTDDRIQVGDVIRIIQAATDTDVIGRVVATQNGITPDDDPTELTITVLSGTINTEPIVRGSYTIGTAPDPTGHTSGTIRMLPILHKSYFNDNVGPQTVWSDTNIYQGKPSGSDFWVRGGATYDPQNVPGVVTSMRVRLQRGTLRDYPPRLTIVLMNIYRQLVGSTFTVIGWGDVVASIDGPQLVSTDPTEFAIPVSWLTDLWADLSSGNKKALGIYTEESADPVGLLGDQFQILADWEGNV